MHPCHATSQTTVGVRANSRTSLCSCLAATWRPLHSKRRMKTGVDLSRSQPLARSLVTQTGDWTADVWESRLLLGPAARGPWHRKGRNMADTFRRWRAIGAGLTALAATLVSPSIAEAAVTSYSTTTAYVGGGTTVNVRSAPVITIGNPNNTVYTLPTGRVLSIECQLVGGKLGFSQYAENRTWDKLSDGRYIHDAVTTAPADQGRQSLPDGGYVRYSSTIPRCGAASTRDKAVAAARATIGHVRAQDTNDAAYFSAADWAPGPYGEWSGDCVKLAVASYRKANLSIPTAGSAAAMYRLYSSKGLIRSGSAPSGALIFWPNAAEGAGHVAISLGDGTVATTNGRDGSQQANSIRGIAYFGAPAGWALPPGS